MSVETFQPDNAASQPPQVTATESARTHILQQIEKSGAAFLRLGVKESGCNGYMYTLDYISEPESDDIAIELGDDLAVYVAQTELPMVNGTELDYVVEGLNATLQFKNANAQSYCGCGESFSIN